MPLVLHRIGEGYLVRFRERTSRSGNIVGWWELKEDEQGSVALKLDHKPHLIGVVESANDVNPRALAGLRSFERGGVVGWRYLSPGEEVKVGNEERGIRIESY